MLVLASAMAAVTLGLAAEGLLSEHWGKPPLIKHESVYGYVNLVCAAIVCAAATHMLLLIAGAVSGRGESKYPTA